MDVEVALDYDNLDPPQLVTVPAEAWREAQAALKRVPVLVEQLAQERELSARITTEFQGYMREHQVLHAQQKAGS